MKHSFAPNTDLEICPQLRRSQNCRWGRQTQPGRSVAINKEQRAYPDPSLCSLRNKTSRQQSETIRLGRVWDNIWLVLIFTGEAGE